MKKKLDFLTKAKLIYSGELFLFALVFGVIALLEFLQVIKISENHKVFFNWITLFGGTWIIADFFWALFSPKRRKKVAFIDKMLHLPAGLYLVIFDLFCLITKPQNHLVYQYGIPIVLSYLCTCYGFEAVYHYFHIIPGLIEIEEDNKIEQEAAVLDNVIIEEEKREKL